MFPNSTLADKSIVFEGIFSLYCLFKKSFDLGKYWLQVISATTVIFDWGGNS